MTTTNPGPAGPHGMTAAVLTRVGAPLQVTEVPAPEVSRGGVLIAVRAAGVCHTDLHLVDAIPDRPPVPMILGHEIAGEVTASEDSRWLPGDRVMVYYYNGCRSCQWCRTGQENLCPRPGAKWGFDTDGGYAQYFAAPARCLVRIPDDCSFAEAAAAGCAGTTAVHVVEQVGQVRAGETVAVIGAGGVGLACLQVAQGAGARTVAVDLRSAAREVAAAQGATLCLDPEREDVDEAVARLTDGRGCDVVVDTVGNQHTTADAVRLAARQGRVVLVGYTGDRALVDLSQIITREVRLLGSVGATLADAHRAMDLVRAGSLRPVVEREVPLVEVNEALRQLRGAGARGRLVLVP